MPPITAVAGDAFQVRVVGRIEGQETNNVLHFTANNAIDDVELRLILALADCFIDNIIPIMSGAARLDKIVWKRVRPTLGLEVTTVPVSFSPGLGNAAALPSFNSAVFSIRTMQGGRSHRGRMYLAGIPEAATLVSAFDTTHAYWAGLIAFAACLAEKFITGDPPGLNSFQMMVYSRKLGGSTFPYGAAGFTAVSSITPVVQLGTTRSRKVGRGS